VFNLREELRGRWSKLVLVVIATFVICWSPHQVPMAHAILAQTHQVNENKMSTIILNYKTTLFSYHFG
jgi:hypothetical protein